jgi:hypothetical protein
MHSRDTLDTIQSGQTHVQTQPAYLVHTACTTCLQKHRHSASHRDFASPRLTCISMSVGTLCITPSSTRRARITDQQKDYRTKPSMQRNIPMHQKTAAQRQAAPPSTRKKHSVHCACISQRWLPQPCKILNALHHAFVGDMPNNTEGFLGVLLKQAVPYLERQRRPLRKRMECLNSLRSGTL